MKTIEYSVIPRKNPLRPEDNALFYAQIKAKEVVSLEQTCEMISRRCTVTKPDIMAVVAAFEENAIDGLLSGQIIRMGDLGSFRLTAKSEGTNTEKEFTSSKIKSPRIRFTPGKGLKKAMKTATFTTATTCKKTATEEGAEE